ncbi:unnamed protein product [Diamesa tonsa]
MICKYFILVLIFLGTASCSETPETEGTTEIEGYMICRSCGQDSTILNLIDNTRVSPFSLGISNITINEKNLLVQELRNPAGISYKVVISKRANCAKIKSWYSESTWFTGHSWKVCICPHCQSHIGWMFEPDTATTKSFFPSEQGFYAIIIDNIIAESYVNSLLMLDKILRN